MATLNEVFEQAETAFANQNWAESLRKYVAVIQAAPRFTRARYRVADTLLNLGDPDKAKEVYKGLAWHYIKAGHPLLGLVVCKMVLAIDPGYDDMLYILAELYSSESDRVGDVDLPDPLPLPDGAPAPDIPPLEEPTLLETAAKIASDTDPITEVPPRFPLIPLFSHLTEDAFIKVLGSLKLRRCQDGQAIITEGEQGDSFFMLADGVVQVGKTVGGKETVLAHLHQGAVFGEMALVSNAARAATVKAMGDVDLLELSRRDLEEHAGELESVKQALKKFTRGRFLANLAATSPLFKPLDKPERRQLMKRFQPKKTYPGDIIIEEGEAGKGIYLVLRGDYVVTKKDGDKNVEIATLRGSDVFGEISLLNSQPTTATVTAGSIGEVLFLPREDFHEVIDTHPEVKATLDQLSADRIRELKEAVPGEVITDDSGILV